MITNLFSAIPDGSATLSIVTWLWGGFSVDNPTLNRFFALHYLLPFVIVGRGGAAHLGAAHAFRVQQPADGIDAERAAGHHQLPSLLHREGPVRAGRVPDGLCAFFVFYAPNFLGHPDNYIPADPLVTPPHIVPEWYFLPFYAILRAFTDGLVVFPDLPRLVDGGQAGGCAGDVRLADRAGGPALVGYLAGAVLQVPAVRINGSPWILVAVFLFLGYLGAKPADGWYVIAAQWATLYYFLHFLILTPLVGWIERPKPLPSSISKPVMRLRPSKGGNENA